MTARARLLELAARVEGAVAEARDALLPADEPAPYPCWDIARDLSAGHRIAAALRARAEEVTDAE